jgi:di/tricarboxylate transporter
VSSIAVERQFNAIGMFDLLPMGLIFLVAGFIYLFTVGMKLIPDRRKDDELTEDFKMQEYLTDIIINENSNLVGTILDHEDLTSQLDLDVIRVFSSDQDSSAQRSKIEIKAGDILRIRGSAGEIKKLLEREDISLEPSKEWVDRDLKHGQDTLVEAVIAPESTLDGTELSKFNFSENTGAVPLAIRHHGKLQQDRLEDVRMSGGDSILLSMSSDRLPELENNPAFVVVSELDILDHRPEKTPIAIAILAGVVATAALGFAPIVITAVVGVLLMILTGCIKTQEAYEAVNWKVVMLLAGVLPLGTAMDVTGAAEMLASGMVTGLSDFGPRMMLGGFFLLTLLITAVMSNNASAALLAPIAIQTSQSIGVAVEPFLYAVTFAASLSFITPFGYQTNTMIYGAGQYQMKDFLVVGTPLNILFLILAIIFIPMIWPF